MGADSMVLAMKASFDPDASGELDALYELRFGDQVFDLEVTGGELRARRGEADGADAVIKTDPDTLAGLVFRGGRLGNAVEDGVVQIDGSSRAVNSLLRALS
jgi:alkyl sulfatase BDS1-like metallo-beta-lactamase superfamily hydrolase